MPLIHIEGLEARLAAKKKSRGYEERSELRQAIASLADDQTLRLAPSDGESMRKLKVMTKRAATEVNRDVTYAATENNNLLVWLADVRAAPGKRRGRPPGSGRKAKETPDD